jgi:hypothetical protein
VLFTWTLMDAEQQVGRMGSSRFSTAVNTAEFTDGFSRPISAPHLGSRGAKEIAKSSVKQVHPVLILHSLTYHPIAQGRSQPVELTKRTEFHGSHRGSIGRNDGAGDLTPETWLGCRTDTSMISTGQYSNRSQHQ